MTKSLLICLLTYISAFAGCCFFIMQQQFINDLLLKTLVADIIATVIVYVFSMTFKNSSLYDAYWSVAPPVIAAYWITNIHSANSVLSYLMLSAILFWSLRLTYNWIKGWGGLQHEDWRYKMLHDKNPKIYPLVSLAGIHLFPTLIVFAGMLPVYFALQATATSVSLVTVIGFVISIVAALIQLISDEQMHTFRKIAMKGVNIETGLWKYSRHPNYLGEILFWFGLWVMMTGVTSNYFWAISGTIAMLLMFIFISIPMMETKNLLSKPNYINYMKRVPVLFPFGKS